MRRLLTAGVCLAAVATATAGCSGSGGSGTASSSAPATSPTAPTASPTAAPRPPRPRSGACYRLTYDQAVAPTTERGPVGCGRAHTATTYLVGELDTVVDGHLLAVDAARVQDQVAEECPARLGRFLGATPAQLRLTSLRAVWFSPTLEQADTGQSWFRCDVIALAREGRLASLDGRLAGALRTPDGRRRFGICGTARPDAPGFARVICSAPHTWRALTSYDVKGDAYPGGAALQTAAQAPCQAAAKAVAADPLDYEWGYDWPTREQWLAGQHYGLCWAPDA
ncbi:MAG: septum formation family protein [Nocardioidaceae bacterium]